MPDKIALLLEAERRGILPPDKKALLDEARKRGLVQSAAPSAPAADDSAALTPKPGSSGLDKTKWVGQGLLEGVQQAALGTGQVIAQGGPGGMIARKVRDTLGNLTGMDTNADIDVGELVSNKAGQIAGDSRREFEASDAGKSNYGRGARLVGEVLPALAIPSAGAATLPGKMLAGFGTGSLASMFTPVEEGKDFATEKAKQAAVAGVFGGGGEIINKGGQWLRQGAQGRLDDASRVLAEQAGKMGIRLGLPQMSPSVIVRTLANQMERLPFSGGAKIHEKRQNAFNAAVAKAFGETGPVTKITHDVYQRNKQRISAEFERLTSSNDLRMTDYLKRQLQGVARKAEREGGTDAGRMVRAQVDNLLAAARNKNFTVKGKKYQALDSEINALAKQGGNEGFHLSRLLNVMRKGMDSSISGADKAAWKTARRQYAALKNLQPLLAKSSVGDVSPARLMERVTAKDADQIRMLAGNSDVLGDLARVGQRFLKEPPNSGTADRQVIMRMLGNPMVQTGATAGSLGVAQQQGWISPTTAMQMAALLAANRAGVGVLNSRALAQGSRTAGVIGAAAPKLLPPLALNWNQGDE